MTSETTKAVGQDGGGDDTQVPKSIALPDGNKFMVFRGILQDGTPQSPVCRGNHIIWDSARGLMVGFYRPRVSMPIKCTSPDRTPVFVMSAADIVKKLTAIVPKPASDPIVDVATDYVIDTLFYDPQADKIPDDDTPASDVMATLTIGGARKAISEAIRKGYREISPDPAPDPAPAVGKCEIVSTAHPDIAILMMPLGGAMILHIKPGADFMTAKLIRQYVSQDAAVAWCDGYARRVKEGRK